MKLNTTTDYAFRTLIFLFRLKEGEVARAENIANEMSIPINYLQRVARVLKSNGCIEAVRGQFGGYRLTKKADALTPWDVIHMYEPEAIHSCLEAEMDCSRQNVEYCAMHRLFQCVQAQMEETLRSRTIRQLAAEGEVQDTEKKERSEGFH